MKIEIIIKLKVSMRVSKPSCKKKAPALFTLIQTNNICD